MRIENEKAKRYMNVISIIITSIEYLFRSAGKCIWFMTLLVFHSISF